MRRTRFVILALLFVVVAACGGQAPKASDTGTGLEKPTLKVAYLPVPDAAALHIAIDEGFFAAEGLTIKPEAAQGAAFILGPLEGGSVDVGLMNYVSVIEAKAAGAHDVRIVADAYQAAPNTFVLMVKKGSALKSPADLRGKRIGVATKRSIGTLSTEVLLATYGISANEVTFMEFPLPEMPARLTAGDIDVAWVTEPFITALQKSKGAEKIGDVMSDATADFPVAGWGVTAEFARNHPRTVAAFQRAIGKAQEIAASDSNRVRAIIPTYTKIDAATADIMTLGAFPTTLEAARIERVLTIMRERGYLTKNIDKIDPMLIPLPATTSSPSPAALWCLAC
ncbi:ABC transporter substrate-binding protein [Streptosporangium sp. CA-115845]|uniref:ABC transporter substrate-binding protein n=1 Tax=Streptosporangium sp. CA-115845 TaxID=3240071 RepID=UPI003D91196E